MDDQLSRTAVEWYSDQLLDLFVAVIEKRIDDFDRFNLKVHNLMERAKEMERQQLMEAFTQGISDFVVYSEQPPIDIDKLFERYYEETYKL